MRRAGDLLRRLANPRHPRTHHTARLGREDIVTATTTATRLREALPPTRLPDAPATADHLRRVAELAASVGITAWRWDGADFVKIT